MRFRNAIRGAAAFLLILSCILGQSAWACTRVLYVGSDGTVITGRSMDWEEDLHSDLWVFPRGMARDGAAGANSVHWVSKYGSIIAAGYNVGTSDGMNERGLDANLLYLAESNYGKRDPAKPAMSLSVWTQFALDNFATVKEAVDYFKKESFSMLSPNFPNGAAGQVHLVLSDATGDSAIFEYINGKLQIHHSKSYVVVTNSPTYDQQLAIDAYWKNIGGLTFLPGTNRAADRFARASFLIQAIPKSLDKRYISAVPSGTYANQAVASVLSVIRSVSVPLGITTPNQPNISSTIWRTVADQKHLVYYFDSATTPNTFWIPISKLNLAKGAPVLKLPLVGGKIYSGDASNKLQPAKPFSFLPAT